MLQSLVAAFVIGTSGHTVAHETQDEPALRPLAQGNYCELFELIKRPDNTACCWASSCTTQSTWFPPTGACSTSDCRVDMPCGCNGPSTTEKRFVAQRMRIGGASAGDTIMLSTIIATAPHEVEDYCALTNTGGTFVGASVFVYESEFVPELPCHNLIAMGSYRATFEVATTNEFIVVLSFADPGPETCLNFRIAPFVKKDMLGRVPALTTQCSPVAPSSSSEDTCIGAITFADPYLTDRTPMEIRGHIDPHYASHHHPQGTHCTYGVGGSRHFDAYRLVVRGARSVPVEIDVCRGGTGPWTHDLAVFLFRGGWTPFEVDPYCNSDYYIAHSYVRSCDGSDALRATLPPGVYTVVVANWTPDVVTPQVSIPYELSVGSVDGNTGNGSPRIELDCDPIGWLGGTEVGTSIVSWIDGSSIDQDLRTSLPGANAMLQASYALMTSPLTGNIEQDVANRLIALGSCGALLLDWMSGIPTAVNSRSDSIVAVGMLLRNGDPPPPQQLSFGYLGRKIYRQASHLATRHDGLGNVIPIATIANLGTTNQPCIPRVLMRAIEYPARILPFLPPPRWTSEEHQDNGAYNYTPDTSAFYLLNSGRVGSEARIADMAIHPHKCIASSTFPISLCTNRKAAQAGLLLPYVWSVIRVDSTSGDLDPPAQSVDVPGPFNTFSIYRNMQQVFTRPQGFYYDFSSRLVDHQRRESEIH